LVERSAVTTTDETTAIVPDRSTGRKPHTVQAAHPSGVDYDTLFREQQRDRSRETLALQALAAGLAEVKCGTARRARAVHYLLRVERVLSQSLGECGKQEYGKVITRYLNVRHGRAGGAA
jgi:hypothetical protein